MQPSNEDGEGDVVFSAHSCAGFDVVDLVVPRGSYIVGLKTFVQCLLVYYESAERKALLGGTNAQTNR